MRALVALGLVVALGGCGGKPIATVAVDGRECPVTAESLKVATQAAGDEATEAPLEGVLAGCGARIVGALEVDGRTVPWDATATAAVWRADGSLSLGGETLWPSRLSVAPPELPGGADPRSLPTLADVAPTVARSLGLALDDVDGRAIEAPGAPRAAIFVLDAFGYRSWQKLSGQLPTLDSLGAPRLALALYPPVTAVSTATLLTGLEPARHGVTNRTIRSTKSPTLFDAATKAGRRVVAVEGNALAFGLRSADVRLSGDLDGDGNTDDNVLANAARVLSDPGAGQPDLLWVHFHGVDDASHELGPGSAEATARARGIDRALGDLLPRLQPGTLVVVAADHGQHAVEEPGQLGSHGTLLAEDVLVPLWVFVQGDRMGVGGH